MLPLIICDPYSVYNTFNDREKIKPLGFFIGAIGVPDGGGSLSGWVQIFLSW